MTVTTQDYGYLEQDYLQDNEYLKSNAAGSMGWQAKFVVEDDKTLGVQAEFNIADKLKSCGSQLKGYINDKLNPIGLQVEFKIISSSQSGVQVLNSIVDKLNNNGMQFESVVGINPPSAMQSVFTILNSKIIGVQFLSHIIDFLGSSGVQVSSQILGTEVAKGLEVRSDKYPTIPCGDGGYLETPYLEDPYLVYTRCLIPGMQALFNIEDKSSQVGVQSEFHIEDKLNSIGSQVLLKIVDKLSSTAMQMDAKVLGNIGMQVLATLYNTTNLRIMCDFPSRGVSSGNWTASSTATGDFSVDNLNTDVVEQVWRSNSVVTGVHLDCDTGIPQGVFLDTFAMLNHNLSSSANVTLIGSNNSTFSPVGISENIQIYSENGFWIAPTLPNAGYRYWRITIDDSSNTDGYLQIGTVVFGSSKIFQGECFTDQLTFELQDFTDTVRTEGHTNVANSRALKRKVGLNFQSLLFQGQNFKNLRSIFETARTTFKCLWIPTPDPNDSRITERFAVFGKVSKIPVEKHNSKGADYDYVSVIIDIDEAL